MRCLSVSTQVFSVLTLEQLLEIADYVISLLLDLNFLDTNFSLLLESKVAVQNSVHITASVIWAAGATLEFITLDPWHALTDCFVAV